MPPAYRTPTNTPISFVGRPSAGAISGASTDVAVPASEVKTWIASVTASAVPATPLFALVAVLALAGGGLYYLLVERPGLRLFGRRLDS